ncbi:MAG TPA: hypothetical protein VFT22_21355 [Kofleriaceae bacterium]|nr:hypothetical protein [Kofleriaceae bacterium]
MQHALLLLALLPVACASAAASPEPGGKPAPPAAACRPTGPVLFEIDHRVDPGAHIATSNTKVFGTGAWTHDETDADGKAAPQSAGCLDKAELKQLETTLSGATWKVTINRIHCMAVSPAYTVYLVRGKQVFTQKLCSGASLDEKSRAKLDAAVALVEGGAKKPTP